MTAPTATAATIALSAAVPYPPSALDRLYARIERLPAGGWWVYGLVFAAMVAYHHVALWATGSRPFGSLSLDGIVGLAYGPYFLAALHYVIWVAGRAMAAFRPASGMSDAEFARRRYELLTLPAGRLWIPLALGSIVALGSDLSASPAALAPYGGTREVALVVFLPASVFGYGMASIAAWQTIRQLRHVGWLHRDATAIDLYDTGPIHAFSRLTMQIGLGYVFVAYFTLIANATFQIGNAPSLAAMAAAIIVGVACFIVPLWGIHGRLVEKKGELVRGVNARAEALQAELYRRVDTSELAAVADVTEALAGIRATREEIGRLPTWPWPREVLRGFVSAVLLPVVVFLITRYVGELR